MKNILLLYLYGKKNQKFQKN